MLYLLYKSKPIILFLFFRVSGQSKHMEAKKGSKIMVKIIIFIMILISCSNSWASDTYHWGTLDRAEVDVQLYKQFGDRPNSLKSMGIITQLRVTKRDIKLMAFNDKYLMAEVCEFPKTMFFVKDGKSIEKERPQIKEIINKIRETILKKDHNKNNTSLISRITCFMAKSPPYSLSEIVVYPNKILFSSIDGKGNIIGEPTAYQTIEE